VVCGLGDPPLCSISVIYGSILLSEMGFPLAAIQSRAFVLRDVVPRSARWLATMTSSSARRARRIWTSTVRPASRHSLPLNEDVGLCNSEDRVATKFGRSSFIAQLLYDPRSLLRSCSLALRSMRRRESRIFYAGPVSISSWPIARCGLDPGLLPGPSLLDLTAANEVAIVGRTSPRSNGIAGARTRLDRAVRLVRLLHLDSDESAIVSVGDAEGPSHVPARRASFEPIEA